MATLEPCPGCGGLFPPTEGPVHPYMSSSPACWAAYGGILAAEYSDPALLNVHRLSVDCYAVQHPGDGSRQAIQSVGLHLARLMLQLELGLSPGRANDAMLQLARHKDAMSALPRPRRFAMTVADVAPFAGGPRHSAAVEEWARRALHDWSHAHDTVRSWLAEAGLA
ncbi:MAG: DUF5946 family protein [Sphingomicrobium sp.]